MVNDYPTQSRACVSHEAMHQLSRHVKKRAQVRDVTTSAHKYGLKVCIGGVENVYHSVSHHDTKHKK